MTLRLSTRPSVVAIALLSLIALAAAVLGTPDRSSAGATVDCMNPIHWTQGAVVGFNPASGAPGDPVTVNLDTNHPGAPFDAPVEAFLGSGPQDIQPANHVGEGTLAMLSETAVIQGQAPNLPPGNYSVIVCWKVWYLEGVGFEWRWESAPGFTVSAAGTPTPTNVDCENPTEWEPASVDFDPASGAAGHPLNVYVDINHPGNPFDAPVEAFLGAGPADIQSSNFIGEDVLQELTETAAIQGQVPGLAPGSYSVIACWRVIPLEGNEVIWRWASVAGFTVNSGGTPAPTRPPTPTPTPTVPPTPTPTPPSQPTPTRAPLRIVPGVRIDSPPSFDLPKQIPPEPDVYIEHMEITQSAQCLNHGDFRWECEDNEIALIARRYTWIRVYLRAFNSQQDIPTVPVQLEIRRNGQPYTTIDGGVTAYRNPINRNDINATANFFLYCSVCLHGDTLTFRAIADPAGALADPDPNNNYFPRTGPLERVLIHRYPLSITVVPFKNMVSGNVAPVPATADLLRFITRAFPVNQSPAVKVVQAAPLEIYSNGCIDDGYHPGWNYISVLNKAWVTSKKVKAPNQVVGLLQPTSCPADQWPWTVLSDPLWRGGQGVVSVIARGAGNGVTMAQAVGHNLGRRDPCKTVPSSYLAFYYEARGNDPGWPYFVDPPAITHTGIETDSTIISSNWAFTITQHSAVAHPGTEWDAMQTDPRCGMSYLSGPRWVSPFTYAQLFCALSFHAATSLNCRQGNTGSLVPVGSGSEAIPASAPSSGPALLISGIVNPDGTGEIIAVDRLDDIASEEPLTGEFCLDVRAGDVVRDTQCWEPSFDAVPGDPATIMPAGFSVIIPWTDGADQILLRKGTAQLDAVAISANSPTVEVTGPSGGGLKGGTQTVEWTAGDTDGDTLDFTVLYSHDGGATFTPVAAGLTENSVNIDLGGLPGGDQAFFRVLASDNTGNTTTADGALFEVAGKAPEAAIITPEDGAESQFGSALSFNGSASDLEDAEIADEGYEWRSSIDGKLGNGPAIIMEGLSGGLHTITLKVRDSDGQTGTSSIEVFIGVPTWVDVTPDSTIGLAPGSLVKAHVELPYGTDIQNMDLSTFRLKVGTTSLAPTASSIGDADADGMQDALFTFNSGAFFAALPEGTHALVQGSGNLEDGTPFRGYDLVQLGVIGDVDCNGTGDVVDALQILLDIADLESDSDCLAAGDPTCDTEVNIADVLRLLSSAAAIDEPLPSYCAYHLSTVS